jgi:hypothetical protein
MLLGLVLALGFEAMGSPDAADSSSQTPACPVRSVASSYLQDLFDSTAEAPAEAAAPDEACAESGNLRQPASQPYEEPPGPS